MRDNKVYYCHLRAYLFLLIFLSALVTFLTLVCKCSLTFLGFSVAVVLVTSKHTVHRKHNDVFQFTRSIFGASSFDFSLFPRISFLWSVIHHILSERC